MDFNEILARSKAVMNQVENSPRKRTNKQNYNATLSEDDEKPMPIDERLLGNSSSFSMSAPVFSESVAKESKLPKEIIDAMRNVSSTSQSSVSVLDNVANLPKKAPKQNINEVSTKEANNSVDYSLIKMMIEETMRKYIGQLKKTILTESKENSNNGLSMMTKQGNKFRFVTEDGKIFEADLTYKGNLND